MDGWASEDSISLCDISLADLPIINYEIACVALAGVALAMIFAWFRQWTRVRVQREQYSSQHDQLVAATADQLRLTDLLKAIVEGTTDAVFVKDRQGKYLLLNEATSRFVGRPVREILGKDDRDLFTPAHAEFLMERDQAVMNSNCPSTAEELLTAAGVTRTYLAMKAPYRNSQGEVIGLVGVSRDITERKQVESELRQALKMEAVGHLAGGIAHDFNNLLTVIKGYCELLLTAPSDGNLTSVNWRESICEIRDAGDRAARLTGQLLAFSRRAIVKPRVLNLNRAIHELQPLTSRLIGDKITAEVQLADSLPDIVADPAQIEHMLVNLIVNARDAMPEGGHLKVVTSTCVFQSETVFMERLMPPGLYVQLTVSDTGRGIDRELRSKIFEPFFSTRASRSGPSLGLPVVHSIVMECAGAIGFECPETGGTQFHVLLPVQVKTSPLERPSTPDTPTKGLTILVVEDDVSVRTIICNLLQAQGYRVLLASSGNEALQKASTEGYGIDLLLTDVVMPGMSGRELAEALRNHWPDMRILFMSGYTDDAVLRTGIIQHDDFVGKPFTIDALCAKVREALTRA